MIIVSETPPFIPEWSSRWPFHHQNRQLWGIESNRFSSLLIQPSDKGPTLPLLDLWCYSPSVTTGCNPYTVRLTRSRLTSGGTSRPGQHCNRPLYQSTTKRCQITCLSKLPGGNEGSGGAIGKPSALTPGIKGDGWWRVTWRHCAGYIEPTPSSGGETQKEALALVENPTRGDPRFLRFLEESLLAEEENAIRPDHFGTAQLEEPNLEPGRGRGETYGMCECYSFTFCDSKWPLI